VGYAAESTAGARADGVDRDLLGMVMTIGLASSTSPSALTMCSMLSRAQDA
jgi:hypothetical protein